jgi:hypothetical protein
LAVFPNSQQRLNATHQTFPQNVVFSVHFCAFVFCVVVRCGALEQSLLAVTRIQLVCVKSEVAFVQQTQGLGAAAKTQAVPRLHFTLFFGHLFNHLQGALVRPGTCLWHIQDGGAVVHYHDVLSAK